MSGTPSHALPVGLPIPEDDGAAEGLEGRIVPTAHFEATSGGRISLADAGTERLVVYVYPRTGVPGEPVPPGWREIPGAFGCTAESCAFRDHAGRLAALGAAVVGLSAQAMIEQREFAAREGLPYRLLNDSRLVLAELLGLPTFESAAGRLYRRLTFIVRTSRIEKVFYPVFPPDGHAAEVLAWLDPSTVHGRRDVAD